MRLETTRQVCEADQICFTENRDTMLSSLAEAIKLCSVQQSKLSWRCIVCVSLKGAVCGRISIAS